MNILSADDDAAYVLSFSGHALLATPIYCLIARAELQSAHPGLTRFG